MYKEICKLSIVIINYGTAKLTTDCLHSLLPEVNEINAHVIVVDNKSLDDSPKIIEQWIKEKDTKGNITLILSESNSGFSGGNNLGISAQDAEYYLLLNSDTVVRKGALRTLLKTAEDHPDAGLISPRLEWLDGSPQQSCFHYISPVSELVWAAKTGPLTKMLKRFEVPMSVSDDVSHPDWTSFACVMIHNQVFEDIGLMDSEFFMYFEDTEFCRRARDSGWDILHNPASKVVHLHGGSSGMNDNFMSRKRLPRYYYVSRTRYFYKIYGHAGLLAANLLWSLGRLISYFRELLGNKKQHTCKKQWLDIWINFFNPTKTFKLP